MAGVVEAAGSSVSQFRPGDEVYASCSGALAEYVSVAEDKLALKPANLPFEQAAAVPTAADHWLTTPHAQEKLAQRVIQFIEEEIVSERR
jgi:NADPH:quinone reductase-like Zn-dependent oxidoreductase